MLAGMEVEVETSEPMASLTCNLSRLLGICGSTDVDAPTVQTGIASNSSDRKTWTFEFGDMMSCPLTNGQVDVSGFDWRFFFEGKDYSASDPAGNDLLSFENIYDPYGLTPSPDVSLPYRISTTGTEWSATGDPNLVDGIDGAHYFRFACSTRRGIQENSADTPLFECCLDTVTIPTHLTPKFRNSDPSCG